MPLAVLSAVRELVHELLEPLVAEIDAADHQERQHGPRCQGADGQRRRDQDGLVQQGALGDRPYHRELAVGSYARHLLGVEREIVAQNAGGLLRGGLREHGDVVEHGRDIVEESEQARGHGPRDSVARTGRGRYDPLPLR